jgi:phosphatidylinositol glycan class N
MATIGVIYLTFEKKLLAKSKLAGDSTAPADNVLSRSLVGMQVGNALTRAKLQLT